MPNRVQPVAPATQISSMGGVSTTPRVLVARAPCDARLALWLLLFGVYAATLGLDAFGDSDYGGDEPHYLLAAESLVATATWT